MKPRRGLNIYIIKVPFQQDPSHYKRRPVVDIGSRMFKTKVNGHTRLLRREGFMSITSKFKHKSTMFKFGRYPIAHWKRDGLRKPSYVKLDNVHYLSKRAARHLFKKPIGSLSYGESLAMFNRGITFHTLERRELKTGRDMFKLSRYKQYSRKYDPYYYESHNRRHYHSFNKHNNYHKFHRFHRNHRYHKFHTWDRYRTSKNFFRMNRKAKRHEKHFHFRNDSHDRLQMKNAYRALHAIQNQRR